MTKALQLGRSASCVPSNTKVAARARTAAWISDTCCATTDRTWAIAERAVCERWVKPIRSVFVRQGLALRVD